MDYGLTKKGQITAGYYCWIKHPTSNISLVGIIAWLDRRIPHSFRFQSRNNTGDEQRGVLGGGPLEAADVLLGLSARIVTETA